MRAKISGDKPLVYFFILSFILAWMLMSSGNFCTICPNYCTDIWTAKIIKEKRAAH